VKSIYGIARARSVHLPQAVSRLEDRLCASAGQDSMAAAQLAAMQGIEKKLDELIAVLKEKK
jgi:small-conductance mechanosensitive channel